MRKSRSSQHTAPVDETDSSIPPAPGVVAESALEAGLRELSSALAETASGQSQFPESSAAAAGGEVNFLNQDPQLVGDFLVEAREHLTNIERRLLEIEQGSQTAETFHSAFRSFHTLKGLAGFLDYEVIQKVSHEVESLLDLARNGTLALTPAIVDVILQSGDYLGGWLNCIEAGQQGRPAETPPAPDALLERIRAAADGEGPQAAPEKDDASQYGLAEPAAADPVRAASTPGRSGEASLVKVDTSKLEFLVDMVGELVIAQSMLRHNPELSEVKSPRLQRDITHLTRVTGEVQKTAMAMRMVPIGQLFRRMTRLVRDLARKSGKLAELELQGEDVELDRTIVEELADPLVHMLRNSMDHGLEMPEERTAAGKPKCGQVLLKASHQAGMIVIELSDDGRGLDRQKIFRKAVDRGLISPDASLSDAEVFHLIFEPGFSTAEKVTDVSGRGVGMDVVRKHVAKLRGRIEIVSSSGSGTKFLLRLPLTLAIIDGLVVIASGERFIVPIFSVREIFKPRAGSIFTVEGRGEMAMVRDRVLPVVRLGARLGIQREAQAAEDGLMIVGESESRTFCLLVDELAGKQEVVIKSLGPTFKEVRGIAGGAILGDGRVGLILDLATIAGDAGSVSRR